MYNLKKIFITRMLLIVILVLCVVLAGCSTQQNLKDQNLNPDASLAETSMSSDAVQEYEETGTLVS